MGPRRTIFYLLIFVCAISTVIIMFRLHAFQGNGRRIKSEQRSSRQYGPFKEYDYKAHSVYDYEYFQQKENAKITLKMTKPWYLRGGRSYPEPAAKVYGNKLFPDQDPHSDRILNQLMYVPHNYKEVRQSGKLKTIFFPHWDNEQGRNVFQRNKCPVDTCEITASADRAATADMLLYKQNYDTLTVERPANSNQVTMIYFLESPYNTAKEQFSNVQINWTATYRRDSDIVTPYAKWLYYDPSVRQLEQHRNYAANKTKKVAWVVSNCKAWNTRLQFAKELQKHIDVDIYGRCGTLSCPPNDQDRCFDMIETDYKFYLSFENSNCKDYFTEKFFANALSRAILPIVMGARREEYEISAPYRSFIHVEEFGTPKQLAHYLHILDRDDQLYNSYFKWKHTGEFINTYFWCRVCAVLHDEELLQKPRWHTNITEWWFSGDSCTTDSWYSFDAKRK